MIYRVVKITIQKLGIWKEKKKKRGKKGKIETKYSKVDHPSRATNKHRYPSKRA